MRGHPLDDDRVTVREVDIAQILQAEHRAYDAILQDVDNGPKGLTRKSNDWLHPERSGCNIYGTAACGRFRPMVGRPRQSFTQLLCKV
jgi:hypothetical protein